MTSFQPITADVVHQVLNIVDAGLSAGLGSREPGDLCVEAAVCYALGLPHGDDPECVSPALQRLVIILTTFLPLNSCSSLI